MTTRVILLVKIDFPTNPAYSTASLCQFYHEFDDEDILFQGEKEQKSVLQKRWVSWWWSNVKKVKEPNSTYQIDANKVT